MTPVATRRLRKSITAGRLLTPEELHPDPLDRGIENRILFLNRLVALWARMKERRWLQRTTPQQRIAFKEDLEPGVEIYNRLGKSGAPICSCEPAPDQRCLRC